MTPPTDYVPSGLTDLRLVDFEDFGGVTFRGRYDGCLALGLSDSGASFDVATSDGARYSSSMSNGIYTHTVETFVPELSGEMSAKLHRANHRRYVVIFKSAKGRRLAFGYEAGATVSYSNQTADGTGALVTISATSAYPLFEVAYTAAAWGGYFNAWAYVEPEVAVKWGGYANMWRYSVTLSVLTWGEYANAWRKTCRNAYSRAYSQAYNCTSPSPSCSWGGHLNEWAYAEPEVAVLWGAYVNTWLKWVPPSAYSRAYSADYGL